MGKGEGRAEEAASFRLIGGGKRVGTVVSFVESISP
jgi:hypothetical protein